MNTEHEEKLRWLMRVFLEENKKLNLSAFRDEESCWIGNILDSLAFLDILPSLDIHPSEKRVTLRSPGVSILRDVASHGKAPPQHDTPGRLEGRFSDCSIIDIGTGGGFPLLPLAISLPDIQFTGIDSTKKKIDAAQRIVHTMGLSNVTLIWGRAEEHKTKYDLVLARALAPLKKLLPLAVLLLKPNGHLICWKSMNIDTELKESEPIQKKLGFTLIQQHVYELPGEWGRRQLLIFQKT